MNISGQTKEVGSISELTSIIGGFMVDNVVQMFKSDDAAVALDNAKREMVAALAIGYNSAGELVAYAGGLIDGRRPVQKDWLWLVESFKATKLYFGED